MDVRKQTGVAEFERSDLLGRYNIEDDYIDSLREQNKIEHDCLTGIRHGDVKEWNFCWDKYNESRVPSERKLLLKVLGASNDPWLLQR